jgi:hypothetical protein
LPARKPVRSSTIARDSIAGATVVATAIAVSIAAADATANAAAVVVDAVRVVAVADVAAEIAVSAATCRPRNMLRLAATTISRKIRTRRWATSPAFCRVNQFRGSATAVMRRLRASILTTLHMKRGTIRST